MYGRISYRFLDIDAKKTRKWLIFAPPLLFDAPFSGIHQNFWMKLIPQKLERWSYRTVKIA